MYSNRLVIIFIIIIILFISCKKSKDSTPLEENSQPNINCIIDPNTVELKGKSPNLISFTLSSNYYSDTIFSVSAFFNDSITLLMIFGAEPKNNKFFKITDSISFYDSNSVEIEFIFGDLFNNNNTHYIAKDGFLKLEIIDNKKNLLFCNLAFYNQSDVFTGSGRVIFH